MGKIKKSKIAGKIASSAVSLVPGGNVAKIGLKLAGKVAGKAFGRKGRISKKKSLLSRVIKIRKQIVIEREKAKLNKIKMSAFK